MRHVLTAGGAAALLLLMAPGAGAAELGHEATLADGGYAEIRVSSGAELAGEQLSVLVLEEDAALEDPGAGDVVYIDQRAVGDDGAVELRVKLPTDDLAGYWLAANSTGGTERYLAPLDGSEPPTENPTDDPSEDPTDDPTEDPTDDPTEEPTDGPTDDPSEEPTDGTGGGPGEEPTDGTGGGPGEEPTDGTGAGPGEEPTDGSGDGAGSGGGPGAGAGSGSGDGGGFLSQTGAPVGLAAGIALVAVLAGGVTLYLRRRA